MGKNQPCVASKHRAPLSIGTVSQYDNKYQKSLSMKTLLCSHFVTPIVDTEQLTTSETSLGLSLNSAYSPTSLQNKVVHQILQIQILLYKYYKSLPGKI